MSELGLSCLKALSIIDRDQGPCLLRLLTRADLAQTLSWRNHFRSFFLTSAVLSEADHANWYDRYSAESNSLVYVVVERNSAAAVGQASVYNIEFDTGEAEIGRFVVDPARARQGLMTEGCSLLLHACFERLRLQRLTLSVLQDNGPARSLYERIGFVQSSVDGGLVDMELTSRDYYSGPRRPR